MRRATKAVLADGWAAGGARATAGAARHVSNGFAANAEEAAPASSSSSSDGSASPTVPVGRLAWPSGGASDHLLPNEARAAR